jgi:protein-S-isoprenylcysteine O-methyltransferase Ste14
MLGTALALGTLAGFVAVGVGLAGFLLRIRIEEALMTGEFPEAYPAYKKRTAALVPWIW